MELKRLEALGQYQVLDTAPENLFDDLTSLAAYICQTPIASISLTDEKRQWFKSKVGFASTEEPRETTFCAYAILQTELFIVLDTLADERFATNPFVNSSPQIRFYAGAPLITPSGVVLGTLCVLDYVPRELKVEQQEALRILALQVVTQLELRRNLKILKQSIADRKQVEAQLLHNALHDPLTNLPNRALFMDRLGSAIKRIKRHQDYTFAVLFLDLDRFKVINDSLGHTVGDRLLIAIARCLENCLHPEDTVARLGGDEFVILLNDIKHVSDAIRVVKRIQKKLTLPFNLGESEVFTSTSVGVALSKTGYNHPEELLRDADTAMYRAKALGKSRYAIFDLDMHDCAVKLLQLETHLRRAIERQEFRIYYQPIVLLETGKLTGFEALVRWQHPARGLVFPTEFISVAEETGLIVPIGCWMLREACLQMHAWQSQFPKQRLTINVNLSTKQFLQPDLTEQISKILAETKMDARALKLEITESAIMENTESARSLLLQLKDLDIKLQMDDFGTGYSSLSYLHRFPIDGLKIDRSFVNTMNSNRENIEIVQTIITLAHNLGMDVTAEGVETAQQLAQLRGMQCNHGQGYFFSKATDYQSAQALIAKNLQW